MQTIPESTREAPPRESNLSKRNLEALNSSKLIGRIETPKFVMNSKQIDKRKGAGNRSVMSASNSNTLLAKKANEENKLEGAAIKLKNLNN